MDKNEFKRLLFKIAFCTMGCDGDIANSEVDELRDIDKNTSFFNDVDLSQELDQLIAEFKLKGVLLVSELFEQLKQVGLSPLQELIILEVAIRLINADGKQDENEKRFIQHLRAHLKVHDEEIYERFGLLDILRVNPHSRRFNRAVTIKNGLDIQMPEHDELEKVNFRFD
ncbi:MULTISPECIES: TerB family tellurite resistance protein [Gammaproteobacteria]|uniref:tellurite resistance TerB family protein n=1 Tax=Gammaproteobacteria TaxID=1236 RepID=UPI000DD0949C|nr:MULTISPECIES: TerB family tellurite resistance protein [Gammaproteobacteria]RTE85513.1 TerB family tellurite resistance protein [Aliidiomarina sp. B3213]TCZ89483.1 TerB family tellurite resistance protein [Lysobacter sp. N42]